MLKYTHAINIQPIKHTSTLQRSHYVFKEESAQFLLGVVRFLMYAQHGRNLTGVSP